MHFEQCLQPRDEDIETVRTQLRRYNNDFAAGHPRQPLAVFARDDDGRIVGGASGETHWGWLYVDLLWVHERHRRHGIGSGLLRSIEQLADGLGVVGYHLGTTSFQALHFYRRCGYEVWGELDNMPPGHVSYSLRKLAQSRR